ISRPEDATRELLAGGVPTVATRLAEECGTQPAAYLSERPVMSAYALQNRTVYLTYSTTARGLEFMMGYYGFLDRAPLGRDEGDPPSSGCAATTSTTRRAWAAGNRSRRDRAVRYPLRMQETPEYNRTGRQHAAYAGLAASGMTVVFDNMMGGTGCVTGNAPWRWDRPGPGCGGCRLSQDCPIRTLL